MADTNNMQAIDASSGTAQTGLTLEEQKRLITILKEFHPSYASYVKTWKMYLDSYKGGSYVKTYIYKHLREGDESVKKRRERSVYPNYIRPIISLYLSYIFRRKIDRSLTDSEEDEAVGAVEEQVDEAIKEEMEKFWENCDGHGTSIDKFMKKAGVVAKIFGHCGILVDMPDKNVEIMTEAQRKEMNHTPYLALYTPIDIVNWDTDEKGNLEWVRVCEDIPQKSGVFLKEEERGRSTTDQKLENIEKSIKKNEKALPIPQRSDVFFSRKGVPVKRYTTWTKDSWIVHEVRPSRAGDAVAAKEIVEVVGQGTHDLGEVPVVLLYNEEDAVDPILGISFLQDIAPMNIMIMNWMSMLDEEIAQKTLNILVMQDETGAEVTIGSNNVLTYAGDNAPGFIAPASTPGELIQSSIEKCRDEIYRLAKLTGGVGVLKEVRSGVAYSYEFQETEQTLSDSADELEVTENNIHRLWCKWMGTEWKGYIDYPDEFGIEDVLTDITVLEKSIGLVSSPRFKQEVQKKIVPKILPKADETTMKEIDEEIDAFIEVEKQKLIEQVTNPPEIQPGGVIDQQEELQAQGGEQVGT